MEVVIVNLGDADKESDLETLDLLNTLFSLSISPETKKARLQDAFGIAMTEEFESEVQDMCNLGKALVEQGIEQGVEQGGKRKCLIFMYYQKNIRLLFSSRSTLTIHI